MFETGRLFFFSIILFCIGLGDGGEPTCCITSPGQYLWLRWGPYTRPPAATSVGTLILPNCVYVNIHTNINVYLHLCTPTHPQPHLLKHILTEDTRPKFNTSIHKNWITTVGNIERRNKEIFKIFFNILKNVENNL